MFNKVKAIISKRTPAYAQDYLKYLYSRWLQRQAEEKMYAEVALRRKVLERIGQAYTESSLQPKVFGIGLSRTGTTSLSNALQILGYEALHWSRNGQVLGWPELFSTDAATDVPCSAQFESLYYSFPGAKFIYTVRDIDRWKASMIRHTGGMEHPFEWRRRGDRFGKSFRSSIRHVQAWESLYCKYDSWEEAYRSFDHRVHHLFENKPKDRLLIMDITAGDGWKMFCNFLNHEIPPQAFPHIKHWDNPNQKSG